MKIIKLFLVTGLVFLTACEQTPEGEVLEIAKCAPKLVSEVDGVKLYKVNCGKTGYKNVFFSVNGTQSSYQEGKGIYNRYTPNASGEQQ